MLVPLGFAAGQGGASELTGQVIFCRGAVEGIDDGCVDLVVDLAAIPAWRITAVRYWGFPSESWQLDFEHDADLADQLANLARTLPISLTSTQTEATPARRAAAVHLPAASGRPTA